MRELLVCIVVCLVAGCSGWERAPTYAVVDSLRDSLAGVTADSIERLSPAKEFEAAMQRGDHRPIGVCGIACLPAGLTAEDQIFITVDSLIIIPGTGDMIVGPNMARLNIVAERYGTEYNRRLVKYMKDI